MLNLANVKLNWKQSQSNKLWFRNNVKTNNEKEMVQNGNLVPVSWLEISENMPPRHLHPPFLDCVALSYSSAIWGLLFFFSKWVTYKGRNKKLILLFTLEDLLETPLIYSPPWDLYALHQPWRKLARWLIFSIKWSRLKLFSDFY